MRANFQQLALGLAAAAACAGAQATVVFQDNFESYAGDVGDWYVESNYDAEANRGIGLTGASSSGLQALEAFLSPPNEGGAVNGKFVRASRDFSIAAGGDYVLDLSAFNIGFGYEIFLNGIQVGTTQSSGAYSALSQSLGTLGAGDYTLSLGLFQDVAAPGVRYSASFDDIVLRSVDGGSVPEPRSLALVLAALTAGALVRRRALGRPGA